MMSDEPDPIEKIEATVPSGRESQATRSRRIERQKQSRDHEVYPA
jgi:hypothetical protein